MLHAVPELLDALEARLVKGEDPAALLSGIRWFELVGWPEDLAGALVLKRRIKSIQALIAGLRSPLRATLIGMSGSHGYGRDGIPAGTPALAPRTRGRV
jgi:hypothetical protein